MGIDGLIGQGIVLLLFGVLLCTRAAYGVLQYSVQSIDNFIPLGMNNSGEVVGEPQVGLNSASVWSGGNTIQLTPAGLTYPYAGSVNNAGQIVGGGLNSVEWPQGYMWDPKNGYININVPNGYIGSFTAINSSGEIGGYIDSLDIDSRIAAIWTSPQNYMFLPSLGNNGAEVLGLNDSGEAIGDSGDYPSYPGGPGTNIKYGLDHAVLWENGQVIDLTPGYPWSWASAISNQGQVVGTYTTPDMSTTDVFVWDPVNGLTTLPSDNNAYPAAINEEGQVVGFIGDPNGGVGLASLWDNGVLYDLNNLISADSGWVLQQAYAINDLGQIAGIGTYDGNDEGFLLTPVPEPAEISFVTGFCLLIAIHRPRIRR